MNIEQKAKLHLKFIEEFSDGYQIKQNTNADAIFNWFMNNSIPIEPPVILQLTETLKTNKIETDLQEYLADKQVYNNYGRSFMLPDDAEEVARYVGIFIRTILVDIKSKLSK